MSGVVGVNGYYLRKTGERVSELLSRQFVVPTLPEEPTSTTLTWQDGDYEVPFRVGEIVRVPVDNDYAFFRLKDITDNKAVWINATTADLNNYYTKKQIDDKLSKIVPGGGGASGGVELVSQEEYQSKKDNGEIVDNVMYFIVVNNEPYELYIGLHLIAKKGELANISFPYSFPITF